MLFKVKRNESGHEYIYMERSEMMPLIQQESDRNFLTLDFAE